jgi:hypothetical protein
MTHPRTVPAHGGRACGSRAPALLARRRCPARSLENRHTGARCRGTPRRSPRVPGGARSRDRCYGGAPPPVTRATLDVNLVVGVGACCHTVGWRPSLRAEFALYHGRTNVNRMTRREHTISTLKSGPRRRTRTTTGSEVLPMLPAYA